MSDLQHVLSAIQELAGRFQKVEEALIIYLERKPPPPKFKNTDIQFIIAVVAKVYATSERAILSGVKIQHIAWARQIAMTLIRQHIGLSYNSIATIFRKSDHGAVMNALRSVATRKLTNPQERARIAQCEQLLAKRFTVDKL